MIWPLILIALIFVLIMVFLVSFFHTQAVVKVGVAAALAYLYTGDNRHLIAARTVRSLLGSHWVDRMIGSIKRVAAPSSYPEPKRFDQNKRVLLEILAAGKSGLTESLRLKDILREENPSFLRAINRANAKLAEVEFVNALHQHSMPVGQR